jgi:uncharacterized protein (DUF697 family)
MTKKLPPLRAAPATTPEPASLEMVKSTAPPAQVPVQVDRPPPRNERLVAARSLVARYRAWAIAGGAVPAPLLDMAIVTGLQIRMLASLAKLYGVPFDKVRARSLIAALMGGILPQGVAAGVAATTAKAMPGMGTVVGIGTAMASAALATDMIGNRFIVHLEAGRSLVEIDPRCVP